MRRLLITVRDLSAADMEAVDAAWRTVVRTAAGAGVRAWRFGRADEPATVMEFLEWKDPASPLEDEAVRNALDRLDRIAPGSTDEWEEAPA